MHKMFNCRDPLFFVFFTDTSMECKRYDANAVVKLQKKYGFSTVCGHHEAKKHEF